MSLSATAIDWAADRGITKRTLETLGVGSGMAWMPGLDERCEVIAFPYRRGEKIVNRKIRAIRTKSFKQDKGGELRFWNLDAPLQAKAEQVYIVEGEIDLLSLAEAGIPVESLLSVPNGAPEQDNQDPAQLDRYRFVDQALGEGLSGVKRFVLATDNDAAGRALRQDLARLLGAARCWFVEWPQGIKDANEFLLTCGAAELRQYLDEEAREWPVTGLYSLDQIPEPAPLTVWRPGFPEWESKLAFAPTTISIVTGQPGHGKTTMATQIWYQIARDYQIRGAFASFETRAKPHQRRNIRQFMFGAPEASLSDEERDRADRWNNDHFRWIIHPNRRPSLAWLLDTAEVAVVRHNARFVVIDPWNKLEADRPERTRETDWIGDCLDACMDFARDMAVHLQILAHPAKAADHTRRGKHPTLEDISGSKHWDNKTDLGLCVHRPKVFEKGERKTAADLWVLKSRFEECGYPCRLPIDYQLHEGRFRASGYDTV